MSPFNAVEAARGRIAGRRVVPADGVQVTVAGADADAAAAAVHRRTGRPLVGVRVEALD